MARLVRASSATEGDRRLLFLPVVYTRRLSSFSIHDRIKGVKISPLAAVFKKGRCFQCDEFFRDGDHDKLTDADSLATRVTTSLE